MAEQHRPARLAPIAPIGSLLKREGGIVALLGRRSRVELPSHLVAIRALPCLRCGLDPCGEAAHVRLNCAALGKRTAAGAKPDDRWAVPLCNSCHLTDRDAQHKVGELAFWRAVGMNPLRVAQDLHRNSPDVVAMRAAAFAAIAGRGRWT